MADFVDCDLNETEPANESFDIFDNGEPPAKKRRGANVKYEFVEEVETSDDLKQKANVAGLTKINTQNGNVYYECKILPTSMQINNYVSHKKRTLELTGQFNFVDVENMVTDIKEYKSELVEFKYRINEDDPKKTEWEMILTCKKLLDEQRSQKHGNFDATFKLISGGFPVMVWGYSDINRHIHPTGAAIISSESIQTYKWAFEFLKSNRFCIGEWIPTECVADNAQCITTALQQIFPDVHRRNCIAHIIRHIFDVKFGEFEIDKKTDGEIMKNEILELANHAFENHFDLAAAALIEKWKESDHVGIVEFVKQSMELQEIILQHYQELK